MLRAISAISTSKVTLNSCLSSQITCASTAATVKCDTTRPFNVKSGAAYTFKITADAKPSFAAGTSTAFKAEFVKAVGKDYFFKVTAVGKIGASSGFYINSQKAPVTVATISK